MYKVSFVVEDSKLGTIITALQGEVKSFKVDECFSQ
jgi:hypothetical protein